MSYTNETVSWLRCVNNPIADMYGDIERSATATSIKARKQPKQEVVKRDTGDEVISKSVYYVDPYIEPNALSIARKDKLDGEIVEQIYIMCDLYNKPRMVRFLTI